MTRRLKLEELKSQHEKVCKALPPKNSTIDNEKARDVLQEIAEGLVGERYAASLLQSMFNNKVDEGNRSDYLNDFNCFKDAIIKALKNQELRSMPSPDHKTLLQGEEPPQSHEQQMTAKLALLDMKAVKRKYLNGCDE